MLKLPLFKFDPRSLTFRLIVGFVAVIVATLLVVVVPTLWLVRGDLEQQAQARLYQGGNTTSVIYTAHGREIQGLAKLAAERPTLRQFLAQKAGAELSTYLLTLPGTIPPDLLAVYDSTGALFAHTPAGASWTFPNQLPVDSNAASPGLIRLGGSNSRQVALVAISPVFDASSGAGIGAVLTGQVLDDAFASSLRAESGLDQSIYVDGIRIASSVPGMAERADQLTPGLLALGPDLFLTQKISLESNAVDVVALPANDIVAAQTRLLQLLIASSVVLTIVAGGLGYILARRVTAPLRKLVTASEGIGRGDLRTPIPSPRGVIEVMVLARTLERMRVRLGEAREELERAKTWSDNLIASLAEGVLTVDFTGRILSFSPGAERILGWRASDVIGRSLPAVLQNENDPAPTLMPAGSVRRQSVSTRGGKQIVLLITSGTVTRHEDGSSEQALVFRDVTEEEEALRLREFFLANVSHELKTPLSSLRASIELLATELAALTPAEQTELVSSLWLGTIRLEELVDNLLSSASIHSGQLDVRLRPTDFESVAEEALLTTRPLLALRGQRLELEIPSDLAPVWADPRRLVQVLVNLISNASKYGPEETPIKLRVLTRPRQILVQVIDKGNGIPVELQQSLFQPFKRSDDPAHGGVGLGLSIVRTIVERHGGRVGFDTLAGRGSIFWFSLNNCENE